MSTAQWLALAPMIAFMLAGVAAVAYLLGKRSRMHSRAEEAESGQTSPVAAREIGDISQGVRRRLATHHASVLQFRERIRQLSSGQDGPVWQLLVNEAERVLKPTEELSDEIAQAYNEIRQKTSVQVEPGHDRVDSHRVDSHRVDSHRVDSLTGLGSRETIEGTMMFLLALKARYDNLFSLVLIDIDQFGDFNRKHSRAEGDRVLRELADVIKESMRDTDAAARFDGEEFVIVLPETGLQGARVFGERLREKVENNLPISVSCGLATVADGDTPQTILSRADSALYSAKSAGQNCVFQHTGRSINLVKLCATQIVDRAEPLAIQDSAANAVPSANP